MSRQNGIDYDLKACLDNNLQPFEVADIEIVLAVWEGENDGDDWRWILKLKDGRFAFLQGGCDFTGWDCQSSASSAFASDPYLAAHIANNDIQGTAQYARISSQTVFDDLVAQIKAGKRKTWREQKDEEFGIDS